jgi:hypothetical protein
MATTTQDVVVAHIKLIREMGEEIERLNEQLGAAYELLNDLSEYVDQRADVRDGMDGEQRPNEAAQFVQRIHEWNLVFARGAIQ